MTQVLVLRALMLGDLLCATPALRALRAGLRGARITLLGLPWARTLVQRLPSVDEFVEFPGWPGLPERTLDTEAAAQTWAALRARHFDLVLQMHGSGQIVNHMLAQLGARRNAGFCAPSAWRPEADAPRFVPWPERGSEVERLLALTDHLGMPRQGVQLDFPLCEDDRLAAQRLLGPLHGPLHGQHFVVMHPGSQLASRRWPPARFAAVAEGLVARGLNVVLTGTDAERPLTAAVAAALNDTQRGHVLDLGGQTDLWTLGAVIEGAALLVSNDTGVSHIAAALKRPSVIVASGSDVERWAPADTWLHRVLWQNWPCRPCAERVCPHAVDGHSACGSAIPASSVLQTARRLLDAQALQPSPLARAAHA